MRETLVRVERRESIVFEKGEESLFGILHRPLSVDNPPVAVILHGFASSKHGSNRCYVSLSESLARAGIAALRFDFRGAGDSDGNLSDLSLEDLYDDASFIIDNLDRIEGIDAARVALFGASLGGTIAIMTAHRTQRIKAMALWAPVASGELWYYDFIKAHPEYANIDPDKILTSYNGAQLNPKFREQFFCMCTSEILKRLSPLPTLHMHGERDEVITINHQNAFQKACSADGHVHFLKYPNGQHSLGFSPSMSSVIDESATWFQKYL